MGKKSRKRKRRYKPRFFVIIAVFLLLCGGLIKLVFFNHIPWSIEYETDDVLAADVEAFMEDFMQDTYGYMATWEETDLTDWFYDGQSENALMCQAAYDLLVEMRSLRDTDLTFKCKSINVKVTNIEEEEGSYYVTFEEAYECKFPFMKKRSYSQGIAGTMKIVPNGDRYKLTEYTREEDFYSYITEGYEHGNGDIKEQLDSIRENVLDEFETELEALSKLKSEVEYKEVSCDVSYDREAATEYALAHALERNSSEWYVFDDLGGNCQNFGSQVMFSGGIPMDTKGEAVWKYYDIEPDQSNKKRGRSTSWSGVTNFYDYAAENSGFGLCAEVDANIYTAEAGDIMQVGDGTGDYVHTIVSLGPITDRKGNVIDINTVSNTTDRKNYPLSAYNCPYMRLIKIYGYNN